MAKSRSWHDHAYELSAKLAAAERLIESQAATINDQADKLKSCREENDMLRAEIEYLLEDIRYYSRIDGDRY